MTGLVIANTNVLIQIANIQERGRSCETIDSNKASYPKYLQVQATLSCDRLANVSHFTTGFLKDHKQGIDPE